MASSGGTVLLLVTVLAVLYCLWMLLGLVFRMIDLYHERELSAAESRRGGTEQAEGTGGC